eukprot:427602-Amphidinium_carterae.1
MALCVCGGVQHALVVMRQSGAQQHASSGKHQASHCRVNLIPKHDAIEAHCFLRELSSYATYDPVYPQKTSSPPLLRCCVIVTSYLNFSLCWICDL